MRVNLASICIVEKLVFKNIKKDLISLNSFNILFGVLKFCKSVHLNSKTFYILFYPTKYFMLMKKKTKFISLH